MSIKEVAKLAGVSVSTVSRVVNSGDVSAASLETQKKIWDAVHAVGYVPNQNARILRRQPQTGDRAASREIDCIYARIAGPHIDPFFTTLMHATEVEAFAHGYHLRYQYSLSDAISGKAPLPDRGVEAAIVLGRVKEEDLRMLQGFYRYLVCAGLQMNDYAVDQVISHGYHAAVSCVEYLGSLGHTKICYLGETRNEQRYDGYVDAMRALGVEDVSGYVVETAFSPGDGYDAVKSLLERTRDFTALFCANDLLAIGALRALKERKVHVPGDVSLIGINDMETVRYLDPMLTSVNIPLEEMGKHVARILIDRMEGGHRLPVKILLPNTLVCRESCGPAKKT